ncbi:MAG: tellurite resistance protein, partial [Kiritimatiellia bacterium]
MSNLDYAHIEPLIANVEERGRSVAVQFECPASGSVIKAQYTLAAKSTNTMGAQASRTVMYEVRRSIGPMIRGIFGNSAMGRMASGMADSAMRNATMPRSRQSMSGSERNKAVVESFKSVLNQFVWDAKNGRWISAQAARDLMAPFDLQLTEGPVETPYDRQVLARMLVEIANADGKLADAERTFITDFLSPDVGSLDSLLERPPLTGAELSNTAR